MSDQPPPPPPPEGGSWPPPPPPQQGGGWPQQPPPGAWQQQQPPPGYGYGQPAYPYPMVPKTDSGAIIALVLSIASFVVCPVIPAIAALIVASSSERNIAASGGTLTGDSLTKAARIISWIHLGLAALGLIAFFLLVVASAASA